MTMMQLAKKLARDTDYVHMYMELPHGRARVNRIDDVVANGWLGASNPGPPEGVELSDYCDREDAVSITGAIAMYAI